MKKKEKECWDLSLVIFVPLSRGVTFLFFALDSAVYIYASSFIGYTGSGAFVF